MDAIVAAFTVFLLLILALGLGTWIFIGLLVVAFGSLWIVAGFPLDRVGLIAQKVLWSSASTWELSAIPLFVWMGEIIFRTDISERLFRGLAPLVDGIPGRLLHTNVAGCTLFAAVCGSTAATTATVGKITTQALADRRYDNRLSVGSLAGAGSLGLLIPPSIVMIIYGVQAEVSISKLFIAGIIPGLVVAALYSTYIAALCLCRPDFAPRGELRFTWRDRLRALGDLAPVLTLMVIVLGSIYTGIATPSEAAAVGVAGALLLCVLLRELSWGMLFDSLMAAVRTSCMVCIILIAAAVLSSAIGFLHIPGDLAAAIGKMNLSPYGLLLILAVLYILLGLFLDGISIVVMSLPITLPLVIAAGFDPIWFGVFLVLMVELGQVTPPVGFNLFVLQGMTGQPIGTVVRAAFPFFLLMVVAVVIISYFPQLALWLPARL